ncbi:nitric-oxide reductase large subunit [Anaeromyxobacter sp. PSR-1]|uniref:nitric-oxide reductase large subunit n=1 Tax=unclassified Anaeromyxobacter TaxID=2620896 RepID=UPI0005DF7C1D|nr:nitric-oxide reductase large subunit [Anaeromyxobacter sp. PSR-1]GAO04078.1 nitric oxide reductase subunit B [Anaeromyxobacter sp. PSR-1]
MPYRAHWIALFLVLAGSFAILGGYAPRIRSSAPPLPERVIGPGGTTVIEGAAILRGQNVWQSIGGQEVGSVWGHGAYVAPDWTADWLHREANAILDLWARAEGGGRYAALSPERQAALRERLRSTLHENTYSEDARTIRVGPERAAAFEELARHYASVFRDGVDAYAIPAGALSDPARARDMAAFFWWTAWAAVTDRPGQQVTYTQNWPHDPLVGNRPTGQAVVWSVISFVLLLAGIGALVWYHGGRKEPETVAEELPMRDPLFGLRPTPSQRATVKYFWVAAALLVVQIALGALTAHYGVEGSKLYGFPLAEILPYSVTRTWHTQLGIFWIATTWLATGLYVGPAVSGHEPPAQRLGVNLLFLALLVIVVGSLAGQWLSVMQRLGGESWYWFGHQGYEYVDLGRFWQIFLFVGLFLWLGLMLRALWPALRRPSATRPLLLLFVLASLAIALFYGAGLMYGRTTNLAVVEYWRWWVVHLWVEGFFEVFATVVIAFLFVRLGLLHPDKATRATFFSTTVFLAGGIVGTFHHNYFAGTPSSVMALGATFSALEVVPLTLVGLEVWQNIRLTRARTWVSAYRWPIYFFVSVAFWNLVGAGLFGFFINPPIALYYMQGLNTTPVHGHAALFGVYGMLGIGLMLFCLRALRPGAAWKERPIAWSFWLINVGLAMMVMISVLPVGILQTWAAVETGTWWARSAEFMQTPLMNTLRWLRVPGDTVFAAGALVLGWFVLGLATGWSLRRTGRVDEGATDVTEDEEAPAGGRA